MVEKRTGKKMASKMCDLRANATKSQKEKRDAQKVQSCNYNLWSNIIVPFIVKAVPKNFLWSFFLSVPSLGYFWDFGLLVWILSSLVQKNPFFTAPQSK